MELSTAMKGDVPNVFEQKMAMNKIGLKERLKKIVTGVSISLSVLRQRGHESVVKGKNKYCREGTK